MDVSCHSRHWSHVVTMSDVSCHSRHWSDVGCHSRHRSDVVAILVVCCSHVGCQPPQSSLVGCWLPQLPLVRCCSDWSDVSFDVRFIKLFVPLMLSISSLLLLLSMIPSKFGFGSSASRFFYVLRVRLASSACEFGLGVRLDKVGFTSLAWQVQLWESSVVSSAL